MLTAIHRVGDTACGGIAFYYDNNGAPDNMIEAERVTLLDGSHPEKNSVMTCGSCGCEVHPLMLDVLPGKWEQNE